MEVFPFASEFHFRLTDLLFYCTCSEQKKKIYGLFVFLTDPSKNALFASVFFFVFLTDVVFF